MKEIRTRPLSADDAEAAAVIYFDAVHKGTADVYSDAERKAWAGSAPDPIAWHYKLQHIEGIAAESDGVMIGFMTLDAGGYIDLAFVRSDHARRGVGRSLYQWVEARAAAAGIERLTTEASKKARPFFAALGWQIDQEQVVIKDGVGLTNFKMSKRLGTKA